MPRKKKLVESLEELETKATYVSPEDVKVKRLLASIPGGTKCLSVFRYPVGNKGGRPSYIDDISPDQFSYQSIKQMFGGGKFSIEWEDEHGAVTKSILEVEGPRFTFDEEEESSKETPILKAVHDEEDNPVQVQAQRNYSDQGPGYGGISPLELMKVIQEAQDRGEARILKILELTKPERVEQSPDMTKQIFDLAEKVVGMSSQMGGGGEVSPLISALAMFKDPILKIVDTIHTAVNRPSVPPPVHNIQTAQPVQQVQQVQPNPPQQEADVITLMLRNYLPMFIQAAATGADPVTYADMILDQIPESQYPLLSAWINKPDCLEGLVAFNPAIRYQQAWWVALRQAIIEGLNDAANIQPDSTSEQSQQD